ncbi:MAG: hypothetical protein ACE5HP_05935 [Gemmatimonadota bacterium]
MWYDTSVRGPSGLQEAGVGVLRSQDAEELDEAFDDDLEEDLDDEDEEDWEDDWDELDEEGWDEDDLDDDEEEW